MSLPFAGATSSDESGICVRIVQLCKRDQLKWTSTIRPSETLQLDITPTYVIVVDLHNTVQGSLAYTKDGNTIDVCWTPIGVQPVVGVMACDDVDSKLTKLIPTLKDVNVLFHIGDSVYADTLYKKATLKERQSPTYIDKLVELYIRTWNQLPMNCMEHRYIPDDHDFAVDTLLQKHAKTTANRLCFSAITKFIDTLYFAINGGYRRLGHYYATQLITPTTHYIAVSNWVPDVDAIPRFVHNQELVEDLKVLTPDRPVVLMLSRSTFAVIHSGYANKLLHDHEFLWNARGYAAFGKLKQHWRRELTVLCGDLHLPVSYEVVLQDVSYSMHSTGTFSSHVETHPEEDFDVPKKYGVQLRPLYLYKHLVIANSYLQLRGHKVRRIYEHQDIMHNMTILLKYLVNGYGSKS